LETEGIYRLSAGASQLNALRTAFNLAQDASTVPLKNESPIVLAALIKDYFRKLPLPLIPSKFYEPLLKATEGFKYLKDLKDGNVKPLKSVLLQIPRRNLQTVKLICMHLVNVVKHTVQNKMDTKNLAIVFGPTLISPPSNEIDPMAAFKKQNEMNEVIRWLIEWTVTEGEQLFK